MKYILCLLIFCTSSVFAADVTSYELPEVQIQPLGNGSHIKVGRFTEIGRFRLRNPSRNTVSVRSLRLKNYGKSNLEKSLNRAGVYANGAQVSSGYQAAGRTITFTFDDGMTGGLQLRGGDSVILSVQSEVAYARTGDSIQLGLRYKDDLEVVTRSGFVLPVAETFKLQKHTLNSGSLYFHAPEYSGYRRFRTSKRPSIGRFYEKVKKPKKTPLRSRKSFQNRYYR